MVARRFRQFRQRAGLSQAALAKLMFVSARTVRSVEKGTNQFFPSTYRQFLKVLREYRKQKPPKLPDDPKRKRVWTPKKPKPERNLEEIDWKEE
jgi:transcriptional regulator with XRE-family HTH domain